MTRGQRIKTVILRQMRRAVILGQRVKAVSLRQKRRAVIIGILGAGAAVAITHRISLPKRGVVASVDDKEKTFTCHVKAGDWTYHTTGTTTYRLGGTRMHGQMSDVKAGTTVRVTYHLHGKNRVADDLVIQAPKVTPVPKATAAPASVPQGTVPPAPR